MHLAYIPRGGGPNPCYELLKRTGYSIPFAAEPIPAALRGAVRLDALQASGPLNQPVLPELSQLQAIEAEILELQREMVPLCQPEDPIGSGMQLGENAYRRHSAMDAGAYSTAN